MDYIVSLIGLLGLLALGWLLSSDRKNIQYRYVLQLILVEFVLAFILLNTQMGNYLMEAVSNGFNQVMSYAGDGINFVFGGLLNPGSFSFFLNVLLPIIFVSVLIGILHWIGLLNLIIRGIGFIVGLASGRPKLESFNSVSSLILGQSESWIAIKDQLDRVSPERLYTLSASAMSTISLAILGSYMQLIDARYVVVAVVLNLFGAFAITHLLNPYVIKPEDDFDFVSDAAPRVNFFSMLGEYIEVGFRIAIMVGIMLIGFLALIGMINGIFDAIFGITFQGIMGYVFAPLAYIMGVANWHDSIIVGNLMATKLISNEFVAMSELKNNLANGNFELSARSLAMASTFLVSFANFGSIGIIIGCIKAISEKQAKVVSTFGLRLLVGATMVSFLSASIVGLVY